MIIITNKLISQEGKICLFSAFLSLHKHNIFKGLILFRRGGQFAIKRHGTIVLLLVYSILCMYTF